MLFFGRIGMRGVINYEYEGQINYSLHNSQLDLNEAPLLTGAAVLANAAINSRMSNFSLYRCTVKVVA